MLTVMEMTLRDLLTELEPGGPCALAPAGVPAQFLAQVEEMLVRLKDPALLDRLAALVELEEATYRAGRKHNYFADRYGIDILTDTTERCWTGSRAPDSRCSSTRSPPAPWCASGA